MRQIFKIYESFPCQHFRYPFTDKYGIIKVGGERIWNAIFRTES